MLYYFEEVYSMVYFTGDIHGIPWKITKFASKMKLTNIDTIVIPDNYKEFLGNDYDKQVISY